jgi:hypothetical protein
MIQNKSFYYMSSEKLGQKRQFVKRYFWRSYTSWRLPGADSNRRSPGYEAWTNREAYLELVYPNINFGLYCNASTRCTVWIWSLSAKSAIVCASLNTQ